MNFYLRTLNNHNSIIGKNTIKKHIYVYKL